MKMNKRVFSFAIAKECKKILATVVLSVLASSNMAYAYNETNWTGMSPSEAAASSDDNVKTVYLYNVGKQKFLGDGGNWGVEAMLSDVGIPYTISYNSDYSNYTFCHAVGSGYLCPTSKENDEKYKLYFLAAHNDSYGFNLTETSEGSGKYRISYDNGNYYMVAQSVEGTTAGAAENLRVCIMASSALNSVTDDSDEWILVTKKECQDNLVTAAVTSKTKFEEQYAPCTYLIDDYNFSRNHVKIGSWLGVTTDGTTAMVNNQGEMKVPSSTNTPTVTYYVGNGYGVNATDQEKNGAKWTANIFSNGTIKQTISDIATIGWYKVTANVGTNSTTATVKLFAQVGEETGKTGYAEVSSTQAVLVETTTFTDAYDLINETTNQISVQVFVGKDESGSIKPLTFGVTTANGEAYAWTCMDNFTLTYLGALRNKVVLDEDTESIDNMNTQNDEVAKSGQSTMFLHRTLNANKWNSIVLPFSISSDVIKLVFGDGTKISKLAGATDEDHPNWINFTDCTSEGVEAGKLYVIKPVKVDYNTSGVDITSSASNDITLSKGTYYVLDGNYGQDTDYEANVTGDSGKEVYNTDGTVTFMGTYVKKQNVIPVNSYYLSGDKWKYNTTNPSHAKGFRGWLQTTTSNNTANVNYIVAINGVASTDESVTGIDGGFAEKDTLYNVYDLYGRQIKSNAKTVDGLTPGCYIVNGKKTVIK